MYKYFNIYKFLKFINLQILDIKIMQYMLNFLYSLNFF